MVRQSAQTFFLTGFSFMASIIFAVLFLLVELFVAVEPVLPPYLLSQKVPVLVGCSNALVAVCNLSVTLETNSSSCIWSLTEMKISGCSVRWRDDEARYGTSLVRNDKDIYHISTAVEGQIKSIVFEHRSPTGVEWTRDPRTVIS